MSLLDPTNWTQSPAVRHLCGAESGFSKAAEAAVFALATARLSAAVVQPGFDDVGGVSNTQEQRRTVGTW